MANNSFSNNEYYHIYNRGVDKRDIFLDTNDHYRFIKSLREFNQINPVVSLYIKDRIKKDVAVRPLQKDKLVEIIAFCLIPNHYHLILKQLKEGGISEFMKRVNGGYTGFFNYKNKRTGSLFLGKFKSIHINSNEYLLYLSAYINYNYKIHGNKKKMWQFSSVNEYLENKKKTRLCNPEAVLAQFKSRDDYKKYAEESAKDVRIKREESKKYLIEQV
jgi:putative transposase